MSDGHEQRSDHEEATVAASLSEASELVHQRSRLAIMTVLYEMGEADFVEIRGIAKLTDGNLSRHLQVLEDAGLVSVRKGFVGRRPRTVVRLSAQGRRAYEEEIQMLRHLIAGADAVRRGALPGHLTGGLMGSGAEAG